VFKGYWQVPLSEQAKIISAFAMPDGLYQYTVMPFGMQNTPATFQCMINKVISGLDGCAAYLDDVMVFSYYWEQHIHQLHDFLHQLYEAKLRVILMKSEFCHAKVTFLGQVVGQGQVDPASSKVEAITRFPVPADKRDLMRWLVIIRSFAIISH